MPSRVGAALRLIAKDMPRDDDFSRDRSLPPPSVRSRNERGGDLWHDILGDFDRDLRRDLFGDFDRDPRQDLFGDFDRDLW